MPRLPASCNNLSKQAGGRPAAAAGFIGASRGIPTQLSRIRFAGLSAVLDRRSSRAAHPKPCNR